MSETIDIDLGPEDQFKSEAEYLHAVALEAEKKAKELEAARETWADPEV